MVKQGVIKTLEAFLGLFFILFFLLVFLPQEPTPTLVEPIGFLDTLREDATFRSCLIEEDRVCINSSLDEQLSTGFEYTYNISTVPNVIVEDLPETRIFSESIYIAGNATNSTTKVFRVFYWN